MKNKKGNNKKFYRAQFSISQFALILVLSPLIVKPAFAKTQGNYIGLDYINTNLKFREVNDFDPEGNEGKSVYGLPSNSKGFGVNYKYAINYNGIFLAPGVFFEKNRAEVNYNLPYYSITKEPNDSINYKSVKIKNRYGIKVDLGYELTSDISPYITGGYSEIGYHTVNGLFEGYPKDKVDKTKGGYFYGAGLKLDYNDNLSINGEYNVQTKLYTQTSVLNVPNFRTHYDANLRIIKFGISYKF